MKELIKNNLLNIIEPTLYDETGHSYSYVKSIITAVTDSKFEYKIWHDKRGELLFNLPHATSMPYFYRKLRNFQKFFLYYKLTKNAEAIFIPTAQLLDLSILKLYLKNKHAIQDKVFLHFHQFKQKPKKLKTLAKIAKCLPNINIITPTDKLTAIFKSQGFINAATVECPSFVRPQEFAVTSKFEKILFAGAARADKGFAHAVELACGFNKDNITLPFTVQISKPNSNRYDEVTEKNIEKLKKNITENLTLIDSTQSEQDYLNLFVNSICLLPYCQDSYSDKFSGVTLDALYAGCPIITTKDTWMGDTVTKYNAGIALDNFGYENLKAAVDVIIQDFAKFNANAIKAGEELKQLHHPANTVKFLATNATVL